MADPYIRSRYNEKMNDWFLNSSSGEYILDDLITELDRIYAEIDRAVYYDPTYYVVYDEFLAAHARHQEFFEDRDVTLTESGFPLPE